MATVDQVFGFSLLWNVNTKWMQKRIQTEKNATKTNRMTVAWMRQTSQGMHMKRRWNVTTNSRVSCTRHEHECQAYKITTLAMLSNFSSFYISAFCRCFFYFPKLHFFIKQEKIPYQMTLLNFSCEKCCCLLFWSLCLPTTVHQRMSYVFSWQFRKCAYFFFK